MANEQTGAPSAAGHASPQGHAAQGAHAAGHASDHGGGHGGDHDHGFAHVVPRRVLIGVWAALMILTAVTVFAAQFRFGPLEVVVAMTIATVKGALVCLYFMHLRYDRPFHAFVFISALAFVALFISFALMDATQYEPEIRALELEKGVE